MKSNQIIKERAFDVYDSGITRPTDIARKLADEGYIDGDSVRNFRRTITNWVKSKYVSETNPGLSLECVTVGIPLDSVKHGWYKGKHWSIAFKADQEEGPTFEDMLMDHIEDVKSHTFKYEPIKRSISQNGNLLVIDPADIHIGKLASSFETGEEYNNQIAVKRVLDGVEGILSKAAGFNIDQIIFVAGNDVLHVDSPQRKTTSGTPQDTDGMWYDNFLIAKKLYIDVIDKLMQVADVHFMYNPSNHDYTHGFFLADSIKSWYKDCENMTFDVSIAHRKYYTYGTSLIGTTHGDGAKWQDLGKLAAVESPDWSATKHRYVYTHHVHHKIVKDDIGVTIESLRSPSGTDGWHHRNGYDHTPKAVEGFIHSKKHGQVARFTHIF
jgi:hypothetical protein